MSEPRTADPEVIAAHQGLLNEFLASALIDDRYAVQLARRAVYITRLRARIAAQVAARAGHLNGSA